MSEDMKYLTVSEFTERVKRALTQAFPGTVYLKGEISGFKPSSTGHWFFSIKDSHSLVGGIVFKFNQKSILERFKSKGLSSIKDGQEVFVQGTINSYAKAGSYSITISSMEPLGVGDFYQKFEILKQELLGLGYFEKERKQKLPSFPTTIGIITSPTGAALQDMKNVLERRTKGHVTIKLFPVAVQGDNAKTDIARAIQFADYHYRNNLEHRVDVLIIARGGGSIEDLWAFNERVVADAIFQAQLPIVSGVGHEIDFTIADYCADLRAPTPSAAAELISQDSVELETHLSAAKLRIRGVVENLLSNLYQRHANIGTQRLVRTIRMNLESNLQDHLHQTDALQRAMTRKIEKSKHQWALLEQRIMSISPLKVLERGYAVVSTCDDKTLLDASEVAIDEVVSIRLNKGKLQAKIVEKTI